MGESQSVREKIEHVLLSVKDGKKSPEHGMVDIDGIMSEFIGNDDSEQSDDFPKLWTPSQQKNWIHSRNHMRRKLRYDYKH